MAIAESRSLDELESVIERGVHTFVEVGEALLEIRDRRLYRNQGFATFEDYCQKRWGWSRARGYQLIDAAKVAENLSTVVDTPLNERQARELAQLPPEQQREAWTIAVTQSANGQPTAREVAEVVNKSFFDVIRERIATRRKEAEEDQPTPRTASEKRELRELREQMKLNTEHNSALMSVVEAIETLSQPPVSMAEAAAFMVKLDTPDRNWCGRTPIAESNLRELMKGLP